MTAKLVAAGVGFMNNKAHGLTLFDVVKSDNADVAIRILGAALANFIKNFLGARNRE